MTADRFERPEPPPDDVLVPGPALIDSHAHLDMLGDVADVLDRAGRADVNAVVTIGVDPASNAWSVQAAGTLPNVWATVGLHPHDAKLFSSELANEIEAQASHSRVVGVGEAGLDYHYDHSPRDVQRKVFAWHIRLAHKTARALVIHTRDAWDDTFSILEDEGAPAGTVFHCWSGGPEEAARALELGAILSFSGTVTFKNAEPLREAAVLAPLERIVVETDAPFLTPIPHRGKRNEPAYVRLTAAYLAALKNVPQATLAAATIRTTTALFGLA